MEELILNNTRLIYLAIKQLNLKWDTEDEFQDYYDAGLEGLIKGAKNFDKSKNIKESTFLTSCIKNEIKKFIYFKTMPKRFNSNGKDLSLDYELGNNKEGNNYLDLLPDPNINIEEQLEKKLESERLLSAVDQLKNEKDRLVVKMYFGLDGCKEMNSSEIAKKMSVTRSAINARKHRALRALKKYLEKNDRDISIKKQSKIIERRKVMGESKKITSLLDLNNVLFDQISKLNDENSDFEKEIRKSYAVSQLAQQIVANTNTCIKAVKLAKEKNIQNNDELNLIGLKK